MYDTVEQANLRLGHTVIMYNKSPVFVREIGNVGNNIVLNVCELPRQRNVVAVPLTDPGLQVKDLVVGYVNMPEGSLYVRRVPARQYRQGLHQNNVIIERQPNVPHYAFTDLLQAAPFKDMMCGVYPSITEARAMLVKEDNRRSCAFSRRLSIAHDKELGFFELHYKGQRVAWGDPSSFNLPSEFQYLAELIQSEGVNCK